MLVTTCLMFLVIVVVWRRNLVLGVAFLVVFASIELVYFSACFIRVQKGGFLPLISALITMSLMYIWHYGTAQKHNYELQNKISLDTLVHLGTNFGTHSVPGICLIYSNVASGVPPMYAHFVTHFSSLNQVVVFVTLQSLTVAKVPSSQQFVITRISPRELNLFRCNIKYGYKDTRKDPDSFENHLIRTMAEFLQHEQHVMHTTAAARGVQQDPNFRCDSVTYNKECGELGELVEARECGTTYMIGNTCIVASETSSYLKKFVINIVYGALRKNCRHPATPLGVPQASLIEVGMVYRV